MTEKLRTIAEIQEQKIVLKTADAILTKAQLAEHFGITERTLENWMKQGYVSYLKIGGGVRYSLRDVEQHAKARHRVCRMRM